MLPTKAQLHTLAFAVFGVGVFYILDMPLPFLFGSMFACLGAALLGFSLKGFGQISTIARTILGVAIGASITLYLFVQLPLLAYSLALVPVFLLITGAIGFPWFYWVWKLNFATAYYGAMPGGLQDMVIFGIEAGGDARALSLIHATRILVIMALAPLALVHFYGATLDRPVGQPTLQTPVIELAIMVVAAWAGYKGAKRIGLFGASILGPMIVTAALSLAGVIEARPPKEAILFAQFFIGVQLGAHFSGITARELRNFVLAGVSYVVILWLVALAFIRWIVPSGEYAPVDLFLAFAPGGQAEMTILAIVAGADLGFVVVHHIMRIVLVITCAPLLARLMQYWPKPRN